MVSFRATTCFHSKNVLKCIRTNDSGVLCIYHYSHFYSHLSGGVEDVSGSLCSGRITVSRNM